MRASYQALARASPEGHLSDFARGASGPLGAILGASFFTAHPVLGLLGGYALGKNGVEVVLGETSVSSAMRSLGGVAAGTAASVVLGASAPVLGFILGGVGGRAILGRVLGEEQKVEERVRSFLERPVKMIGNRPVWQVALGGVGLLGLGYGVHRMLARRAVSTLVSRFR